MPLVDVVWAWQVKAMRKAPKSARFPGARRNLLQAEPSSTDGPPDWFVLDLEDGNMDNCLNRQDFENLFKADEEAPAYEDVAKMTCEDDCYRSQSACCQCITEEDFNAYLSRPSTTTDDGPARPNTEVTREMSDEELSALPPPEVEICVVVQEPGEEFYLELIPMTSNHLVMVDAPLPEELEGTEC